MNNAVFFGSNDNYILRLGDLLPIRHTGVISKFPLNKLTVVEFFNANISTIIPTFTWLDSSPSNTSLLEASETVRNLFPIIRSLPNPIAICDGACSGNPGPGGWAYAYIDNGAIKYKSGNSNKTTNNIMELTAVIEVLKLNPKTIYSDSSYVVNGIQSWIHTWSRNGWISSTKKPIKNLELWQEIHKIQKGRDKLDIRWIKGHSDPQKAESPFMYEVLSIQNKVDELARAAIHAL